MLYKGTTFCIKKTKISLNLRTEYNQRPLLSSQLFKNSSSLANYLNLKIQVMKCAVRLGNHAQIQLLQYAVHPFNYTGNLGRGTAGSVNYEMR